jgi:hypothetical protein
MEASFDAQVDAIALYRAENMTQAVLNEQAQRESKQKHGGRKR